MPQRLGAILAVAFGVSLSVIDGTVANVALPTIGQQLGISAADSIWIVNAYQLAIMVSRPLRSDQRTPAVLPTYDPPSPLPEQLLRTMP